MEFPLVASLSTPSTLALSALSFPLQTYKISLKALRFGFQVFFPVKHEFRLKTGLKLFTIKPSLCVCLCILYEWRLFQFLSTRLTDCQSGLLK